MRRKGHNENQMYAFIQKKKKAKEKKRNKEKTKKKSKITFVLERREMLYHI